MSSIRRIMRIPAFMTAWSDGGLLCGSGWFSGSVPEIPSDRIPFQDAVSASVSRESRMPAVVVDTDSLRNRCFGEKAMKNMRIRGADVWFMTHIEDADDVFDSFNTDAEMVLAPYHAVRSEADLKDIHSVSDCVIPVVYSVNGEGIVRRRKTDGIIPILDRLADLGFYRTCVLDTDGNVTEELWSSIYDDYPSVIPFVRGGTAVPGGFSNVITGPTVR